MMRMVEIQWKPTARQLRQFGLLCLVFLPSIGWLWGASTQVIAVLVGIAVMLAVGAWWRPNLVRPLYIGMSCIAVPIGMVVGEIAMLLIFFGLFLPIGLLFRLVRRDALKLRMDRTRVSHWQPKHEAEDVASYYQRY